MKKKLLISLTTFVLTISTVSTSVLAAPKLSISFNGKKTKDKIILVKKTPYVDAQKIAKRFGGNAKYDKKKKT